MKHYLLAGALLATLVLAACGGGGGPASPGGVIPPPGSTPPTTYSVSLAWNGGDQLQSPQSIVRRPDAVRLHPLSSNTSVTPVILATNGYPQGSLFGSNLAAFEGSATVTVSPQPSPSMPPVSFTVNGAPVTLATPGSSPNPNEAQETVKAIASSLPGVGTLTASVPAPVSSQVSAPVYVVSFAGISCSDRQTTTNASDWWAGVTFTNGSVAQAPSLASNPDLYLDGPGCSLGGWSNASESGMTLHFPHGGVLLTSALTPFVSLTSANFINAQTSALVSSIVTTLVNGNATDDELIIQTGSGSLVKIAFNELAPFQPSQCASPCNNSQPGFVSFSYEQHGSSQDGF